MACNDGYVLSTDMYREVECVLIGEEPMWNITDMTPTCIPGILIQIIDLLCKPSLAKLTKTYLLFKLSQ